MNPMLPTAATALESLGRNSVQAAVLVVLVLLVQAMGRRHLSAAWRYRLWLLVVLRLVWPFALESSWSVFNLFPSRVAQGASTGPTAHLDPPVALVAGGTFPTEDRTLKQAGSGASLPLPASTAGPSRLGESSAIAELPTSRPTRRPVAERVTENRFLERKAWGIFRWQTWLAVGWLAGAAVLAMRAVALNVSFGRRVRHDLSPIPAGVLALFEQCRTRMGIRLRIRMGESAEVTSPALYGVWRPLLLLPRGMVERFSEEELRFVLLHELAHVRRHDLAVNLLVEVLKAVHWFNPVLWFAFRRMQADRELATDALALSVAGEGQARRYGETILKLLETMARPAAAPAVVGILEDRHQLRDRLRRIIGFKRASRWAVVAVIPLAALAVVTLTEAQTASPGPTASPAASAIPPRAENQAGLSPVDLLPHLVVRWPGGKAGNGLDTMPQGRQTWGGVPFEVAGVVEIRAADAAGRGGERPARVAGIRVGTKVAALHFLHGAGFPEADGTAVAKILWTYANGQSREWMLRYGEHVRSWWVDANESSSKTSDGQTRVAWTGRTGDPAVRPVALRLFHTRFSNPLPSEVLESVEIVAASGRCSLALLGLTAEALGSPVPEAFPVAKELAAAPGGSEFHPVALKSFCTRMYEVINQDPDSSWAYAPQGRHVFNGVLFELPGVMEVSGLGRAREDDPLPTSIRDIPLGRKARRLHLLHGGAADLADGTPLAKLVVHYADGRDHTLPLVYGQNLRNWYKGGDKRDDVSDPNTRLGWTGDSPRSRRFGSTLRIYHTVFDLPWPDVELKSVDFVSLLSESVSVVPAITLESGGANSPAPLAGLAPDAPPPPAIESTELRVRVVDETTGQSIPGAVARVRVTGERGDFKFGEQRPNTRGEIVLDVMLDGSEERAVLAQAPGYQPREVALPAESLPRVFTVRLTPGGRISGRVLGPEDRPLAGAEVLVQRWVNEDPAQPLDILIDRVTTDTNGLWASTKVAPKPTGLGFRVNHPEYLPAEFEADVEDLLAGKARFALKAAPVVSGRVGAGGAEDAPVVGAEVTVASGQGFVNRRFARTGSDGRFRISVPELGRAQIVVQAPRFAPALVSTTLKPDDLSVDFVLEPARKLRGRVFDGVGRPVVGATVYVGSWRRVNVLTWRAETDDQGRFLWDSAPREAFVLVADKAGGAQVRQSVPELLEMGEAEVVIQMSQGPRFSGTVVDAKTREPITGFQVFYSLGQSPMVEPGKAWAPAKFQSERAGTFSLVIDRNDALLYGAELGTEEAVQLMVSAEGYLPNATPLVSGPGDYEHTFEMVKGKGYEGVVQTPDGRPVAGATVGMPGVGRVFLRPDGLHGDGTLPPQVQTTGVGGRFLFTPLLPSPHFVAAHPTLGYGEVSAQDLLATGRLVLQPWGRIEGTAKKGTAPATHQQLSLAPGILADSRIEYEFESYLTLTDEHLGRFVITNVPPGQRLLGKLLPNGYGGFGLSHFVWVDVKPGVTTRVVVGGTGRAVIGKATPSDSATKLDWQKGHFQMASQQSLPRFSSPAEQEAWFRSPAWRQLMRERREYAVEIADDGSFRIEDVPAGNYDLSLWFVSEPGDLGQPPLGTVTRAVIVPEMPGGRSDEPLDLGTVVVQIRAKPDPIPFTPRR